MEKEIFITTIKGKTAPDEIIQGKQKTLETLNMPVDIVGSMVKLQLKNDDEKDGNEQGKFERLLCDTNEVIKLVADNLSKSLDTSNNLSEMEIEFGLSFTEKLGIKIFEFSANQSLNIKIKLQKNGVNGK